MPADCHTSGKVAGVPQLAQESVHSSRVHSSESVPFFILSSILPLTRACLLLRAGTRKNHTAVKSRGALLTAAAWLDADCIGDPLNAIAQADFLLGDEARQSYFERLGFRVFIDANICFVHNSKL